MENSMSRVLIEALVKKTLKELKDAPERSIRNLVDMAQEFSDGRFQQVFFAMAGKALTNENNGYYDIAKDIAINVEEERLLQFGMNLGYNSCTAGASRIRQKESVCGYNIPWTISIQMDMLRLSEIPECYDTLIAQGETMGIYTWMFFVKGRLQDVLSLIRKHPDSAFILFCEPEDLTLQFLDCLIDVKQVMLAVRYKENAESSYDLLRKRRLLYSVFYVYGEKEADYIISGDLFYTTEQLHSIFTGVIPLPGCPAPVLDDVYHAIADFRRKQPFSTIALDLDRDISFIDSIISDDPCFAYFDKDGWLYSRLGEKKHLNVFEQELTGVLKQAFPKQREVTMSVV